VQPQSLLDDQKRKWFAWVERRPILWGIALFAVTALGLSLSLVLFDRLVPTIDGWSIFWPFNGLTIAALLMCDRRRWPWIFAGFLFTFTRSEMGRHEPYAEVAVDVFSNLAEVLVAAYLLPPFDSLKQWMLQPRLTPIFALSAVTVGPALLSLPIGLYFSHYYPEPFWRIAVRWTLSDALGAALWTPLILVLFSRETYDLFRRRALPETLGLLSTLSLVSWVCFHQTRYSIDFLPYPILLQTQPSSGTRSQ
jgi:integral membrane sensor domain MASE1